MVGGFFDRPGFVWVVVSRKSALAVFEGCSLAYIVGTCFGRCCRVRPGGAKKWHTTVPVQIQEERVLRVLGASFKKGGGLVVMQPEEGTGCCRFQQPDTGLCSLHTKLDDNGTPLKPKSCFISPWVLTRGNRLVISYRYRALSCHRVRPGVPAYVAFGSGLVALFGAEQTKAIVRHLREGGGDVGGWMRKEMVGFLRGRTRHWRGVK